MHDSMTTSVFVPQHAQVLQSSEDLACYLFEHGLDLARPFMRLEVRRQCECMDERCRLPHMSGLLYMQDSEEWTYSASS